MSTILVVEDSPILRQTMEAALQREGYQTMSAEHGREALERIAQKRPDLILLDMAMPVMDGLEFLRIRRRDPELAKIPVVILSARNGKEDILAAAALGIEGYLLKSSFSLEQMFKKIREVLAGGGRRSVGGEQEAGGGGRGPKVASVQNVEVAGRSGGVGKLTEKKAVVVSRSGETGKEAADQEVKGGGSDPAEKLRLLKAIRLRSEVVEQLARAEQLKAFSPAVTMVLKITRNPNCAMEDVVRAISQDHAIALKIFKMANSVVYTRGEPVDSVQKAVMRIGLEKIRQAMLNIGVIDRFSSAAVARHVDMGQFWEHSIGCGIIAAELAYAMGEAVEADTAFTMGLLHDVGRIICIEQMTEDYAQVLKTAREWELPLEQVESRMLMINHADVMEHLLRIWNFSPNLIGPITHHHLSAELIRQSALGQMIETGILALANRLAHAFLLGSSGNETIYPTHDLVNLLRLDGKVIQAIDRTARQQTLDIKLVLLNMGPSSKWVQARQQYLAQLPGPMRPLFVSVHGAADAYGYFCRELAVEGEEGLPNIAVVHLSNVRDRAAVSSLLEQAEEKAGVTKLPLVVISPLGKLNVEESTARGRPRVELVASPMPVSRFLRAVGACLGGGAGQAAA